MPFTLFPFLVDAEGLARKSALKAQKAAAASLAASRAAFESSSAPSRYAPSTCPRKRTKYYAVRKGRKSGITRRHGLRCGVAAPPNGEPSFLPKGNVLHQMQATWALPPGGWMKPVANVVANVGQTVLVVVGLRHAGAPAETQNSKCVGRIFGFDRTMITRLTVPKGALDEPSRHPGTARECEYRPRRKEPRRQPEAFQAQRRIRP